MILVTGASGSNGSELLKLLSEKGVRVRAMSRKGPAGESNAVELVTADLDDSASIHCALEGVQTLLDEIVGDVANTFGYERLAVLLKDEGTDELVIVSAEDPRRAIGHFQPAAYRDDRIFAGVHSPARGTRRPCGNGDRKRTNVSARAF